MEYLMTVEAEGPEQAVIKARKKQNLETQAAGKDTYDNAEYSAVPINNIHYIGVAGEMPPGGFL